MNYMLLGAHSGPLLEIIVIANPLSSRDCHYRIIEDFLFELY
jgi:hypothetical protein